MAFPPSPKSGAIARALQSPGGGMPPAPVPAAAPTPGPTGDEASADPQDIQVITAAAQNDPVIAAIARVIGVM